MSELANSCPNIADISLRNTIQKRRHSFPHAGSILYDSDFNTDEREFGNDKYGTVETSSHSFINETDLKRDNETDSIFSSSLKSSDSSDVSLLYFKRITRAYSTSSIASRDSSYHSDDEYQIVDTEGTKLSELTEEDELSFIQEEDFDVFNAELISINTPTYVQCTFLESGKICINVQKGFINKANDYFKKYFSKYYKFLDIMEAGEFQFFGLSTETDGYVLRDWGEYFSKIQAGSTIKVTNSIDLGNIPANDYSLNYTKPYSRGTVGAVCMDKNERYYIITAKHVMENTLDDVPTHMSRLNGFTCGINFHSFCTISKFSGNNRTHSEDIHVGNSYYGIFTPSVVKNDDSSLINKNQVTSSMLPGIDLAAIPLLKNIDTDSKVNPYFIKENITLKLFEGRPPAEEKTDSLGAKSGRVSGKIVVPNSYLYVYGKYIAKDCFVVTPHGDETRFYQLGDSGAVVAGCMPESSRKNHLSVATNVTPVNGEQVSTANNMCGEACASGNDDIRLADSNKEPHGLEEMLVYGMFFYLQDEFPIRGSQRSTTAAWCIRLDLALQCIKQKWGIDLDFVQPSCIDTSNAKLKQN